TARARSRGAGARGNRARRHRLRNVVVAQRHDAGSLVCATAGRGCRRDCARDALAEIKPSAQRHGGTEIAEKTLSIRDQNFDFCSFSAPSVFSVLSAPLCIEISLTASSLSKQTPPDMRRENVVSWNWRQGRHRRDRPNSFCPKARPI